MFTYYSRLFFSIVFIVFLQACGGGSEVESSKKDDTKQPASAVKQNITRENHIDLAQYYFQHQSTLIQVSARVDSLDTYKENSIPGGVTNSDNDTFTVFAVTPFNQYVEHLDITHKDMKIEIDVVRKMYVTIKLYKSDVLVVQTQKTVEEFTQSGLTRPTGDAS